MVDEKQKILIVDDSELNRTLLAGILQNDYTVVEAENGMEAVGILAQNESDFWLVLLDLDMPQMNGFDVLNSINSHYWNNRVVVMMIASVDCVDDMNRAYSLGAFDCIGRPFDPVIVHKRIENTLLLFARQRDLEQAVQFQYRKQQKRDDLLISILSHIVEFRNGESGLHLQQVRIITEMLLRQLTQVTDRYSLTEERIALISMTSAMHDIGKISIPEEILNKPGKLTDEEYELMKQHALIGAQILSALPSEQFHTPLVQIAYEICRWHHERYDGAGYPDGLRGEEIPIAAQVVSLADVYDALTSDRCYKKAFSHEKAIAMIQHGECGIFNPLLLDCLNRIELPLKTLRKNINVQNQNGSYSSALIKMDAIDQVSFFAEELNEPDQVGGYMQLLYIDEMTQVLNRRYYAEYIQHRKDYIAAILVDVAVDSKCLEELNSKNQNH